MPQSRLCLDNMVSDFFRSNPSLQKQAHYRFTIPEGQAEKGKTGWGAGVWKKYESEGEKLGRATVGAVHGDWRLLGPPSPPRRRISSERRRLARAAATRLSQQKRRVWDRN